MTDKLRSAGAKLANIAYNLAQRKDLPADILACLDASRKEWDEAVRAPSAPVAPDQNAAFETWAKREGLIQESHGIRSTSSACAVAQRAFDAGAALSVKAESAAIPEGWKLVPEDPTGDMFRAAAKVDNDAFAGGSSHGADDEQIWHAMYFAAPTPPTTGEA